MEQSPTYYRTPQEVYEDGLLLPVTQLGEVEESARLAAILEVARRLRESDYRELERRFDVAEWFVPDPEDFGLVVPFVAGARPEDVQGAEALEGAEEIAEGLRIGSGDLKPYAVVVYLSPALEEVPPEVAVAVVAYQLAHLVFEHPLIGPVRGLGRQERDAGEMVRAWGFGAEVEALEAMRASGGQ